MNIGSIMKYYRLQNRMTQAELSEGICSVSHLSKIESNKYSAHKETLEDIFKRMNIEWENQIHVYQKFEEKLVEFIGYAIYYDFESMESLYVELQADEGYLQSTDLVNKYELYKLRYYLYKRDSSKAEDQLQLIDKLTPTFNASEQVISTVISIMYYISTGDDKEAENLFAKLDETPDEKSLLKLLEGEYFYQKSWLLHKRAHYGQSSYYANLAIEYFQKDCNYIRLMHAQILLAINFSNQEYYLWAKDLFVMLMRNTRMMGQEELYQHTLYNYSLLQKRMGNNENAHQLFKKLKDIISPESEFYDSVLLSMLHTSIGTDREEPQILKELQERENKFNDPYLKIQLRYFAKMKISKQELYNYCEETMFPFLIKSGYIRESRRVASRLTKYYREIKDFEKVDFYNSYYNGEGDEKL